MRVVLGEAAHAHQSVQRARGLVAVAGTELGQAQGQVAIALEPAVVDLHMRRTVHRLDRELALFGAGDEHVVHELVGVARLFPQRQVDQRRRMHLAITLALETRANVVGDLQIDLPAAVMPEHHARRFFLNMEKILAPTDQAMIPLLGFFYMGQISFEVFLVRPGGAVDTGQHLVVGIAAPVGAGEAGQLEGTQVARVRHMGADTHVRVVFVVIQGDGLALGDTPHDFLLVGLVPGLEGGQRLFTSDHLADHLMIALGQFVHACLYLFEIFGRERAIDGDIVIKALVNDRPDGHLDVRVDRLERLPEQMRTGVADDIQPLGIARRNQRDFGIVIDLDTGVGKAPIDTGRERGFCQPRADRLGHLHAGHRMVELFDGTVGKSNSGHGIPFVSGGPYQRPRACHSPPGECLKQKSRGRENPAAAFSIILVAGASGFDNLAKRGNATEGSPKDRLRREADNPDPQGRW